MHLYKMQAKHWPLHQSRMGHSCQIMARTLHGKRNRIGIKSKPYIIAVGSLERLAGKQILLQQAVLLT